MSSKILTNKITPWTSHGALPFLCHHPIGLLKTCCCGASWENPPVELHLMTCKIKKVLGTLCIAQSIRCAISMLSLNGDVLVIFLQDKELNLRIQILPYSSIFKLVQPISDIFLKLPSNHSGATFNPKLESSVDETPRSRQTSRSPQLYRAVGDSAT